MWWAISEISIADAALRCLKALDESTSQDTQPQPYNAEGGHNGEALPIRAGNSKLVNSVTLSLCLLGAAAPSWYWRFTLRAPLCQQSFG